MIYIMFIILIGIDKKKLIILRYISQYMLRYIHEMRDERYL